MSKITKQHEYWYFKGIEDLLMFFLDSLPEENQKTMRSTFNAITNQLKRNFELIKRIQND